MIGAAVIMRQGRWAAVLLFLVAGPLAGCSGETAVPVGWGGGDPSGYELAFAETGGREVLGEATGPVASWGFGCRQVFRGGSSGDGALLQHPCGPNKQVFAVTGDFWTYYSSHGPDAPNTFGFPLGRRGFLRGGWRQPFGSGAGRASYFMQRPGGRVHVLTGPILDRYLNEPGLEERLGFPITDPVEASDGRMFQEFEHGSFAAGGPDPART